MAKIIDDFGYRMKIPEEDYKAITLVDNGINPYKTLKKKSLQHKVINEYKRRLIINIVAFIKKSTKNKQFVFKKLNLRKKITTHKNKKKALKEQLHKINWKKLDNLYKQILQDGRTKKVIFPKSRKTRKIRK